MTIIKSTLNNYKTMTVGIDNLEGKKKDLNMSRNHTKV